MIILLKCLRYALQLLCYNTIEQNVFEMIPSNIRDHGNETKVVAYTCKYSSGHLQIKCPLENLQV